ncbi:MAG: nucleotide pyrophosphohydrolase [Pseudomonadales bacterium]|nr:nucleotide pyrophosphohydrolase [Gammaproteobacteria bacterium]NNL57177.1 nucleotide pyrophosphohydrolase [Pseudomonadales bacterium]
MKTLEDIRARSAAFAAERDWQAYQTPKNLAMALSVEVTELLEHFQWLTAEQSRALDDRALEAVSNEIADVQLYLVRLADELQVDILEAVNRKVELNAKKYPVERVRGSAKKYSDY